MKYLTNSGLSYFLNKIKAYLTSSTYLNSIGISNSEIDNIADNEGYSSGSLPASEDVFLTGDIIPNTDNSVDLGASSKNIKMIYTKGIIINGTQFLPSDYIPRSGGAVITGANMYRNNTTEGLNIGGGTAWNTGAIVSVQGAENENQPGYVFIQPATSSTAKSWMYLLPNGTWSWSGQPCQTSSDQRLKQQISNIDNNLLDAWEDVTPVQFKYNDAVNSKGNAARLHTGYVVQQIDEACQKHNIDISEYGLYCHEEYPERTEEVTIENEDGTTTKETRVIEPAKEHYSLRYTETLVVECAFLRKRIKELEERLEKLELQ